MTTIHPSWLANQPTVGVHPSWLEQPATAPAAEPEGVHRSWLGEAFTGLQRGMISGPSQLISAARAGAELVGLGGAIAPIERAATTLTDVVKDALYPRSPRSGTWDARGIAGDIGEMVPQVSSALAGGLIPGGLPVEIAAFAGTAAAPVVGQTFQDAMKEHGDPRRASIEAAANGAITAITSVLPGAALLRKVPGGEQIVAGATRRILGRIGMAALAEGGQEATEQIGQAFAEEMVRHDRALTPALARELLTSPDRLNEYLYAGTLGALTGGAARVAHEAPTIARRLAEPQSARKPSPAARRNLSDPAALEAWVAANPEKATELAGANPSRAEFDRLGVPGRYEAPERAQIVEDVRILSSKPRTGTPPVAEGEQAAFAPPANYNPTPTGPVGGPPKPSPIVGQSPFPEGSDLSRFKVIQQLGQDFGVAALRRGRIGTDRAAAVYKTKPHVIRFRARYGGDLGVAVHEIAHHLSNTTDALKGAPAAAQQDVAQNDYDQNRLDPEEGFAEYMRYLLVGDDGPTRAPQFHQHFMSWLAANPEAARNVGRARAMIDQVRSQSALQQARANQSITGKPSRANLSLTERAGQAIGQPLKGFYRSLVGPFNALIEAEKESGLDLGGDAPSMQAAAYNMAPGHFAQTATTGDGVYSVLDPTQRIGESMKAALSEIDLTEWRDFSAFWQAVQALEVHARNRGPLAPGTPKVHPAMSEDVANGTVNAIRADPAKFQRFSRTQQRMTAYANSILKMRLEVGNISQDDYDNLVNTWTQYAPIIPVREARSLAGSWGRSVDTRHGLRRRKGGDYEVLDPLLAMMSKTIEGYQEAVRQQVFNSLVRMHDRTDFEGMGDFIEEVPVGASDPENGVFLYRKDGKERMFQVNRPIYQSLQMVSGMGMSPSAIEKVLDWLRFDKVNKLVRAGATRFNPSFILSNLARDFVTQIIQTENGSLRAAVDLPATAARLAIHHMSAVTGRGHDQMAALYDRVGGHLAGRMGQDNAEQRATIRKVMRNPPLRRALGIVGKVGMSPIAAITAATDGLENTPRFAEFTRTLERLGHTRETIRQGKPIPQTDLVQAWVASKDVTTDFSRGGLLGRRINRYVPFFTAALLGTDKFARTLGKHPVRTMARLSPLIAATVLLWAMKRDDDEYEEQPDWLKYGFWSFDTNGDGRSDVRIPRPHDWGWVFFSSIEATLDAIYREDPQIIKDYLGAMLENAAPNLTPTPIKSAAEVYFNWDTFRNREILDRRMLELEAADQYGPNTSALMREAGKMLNLSPALMDHFVDGITGGGYSRFADFVETFDIGKMTLSGVTLSNDYTRTVNDFYQEADRANRAFQSSRITPGSTELSEGDRALADESYRLNWYAGIMADLRRLVPQDAERNERFIINRYINGLARHAMGEEPLPLYPSPIGAEDAPDSVKAIIGDNLRRLRERAAQHARTPSSILSRQRAQMLLRTIR